MLFTPIKNKNKAMLGIISLIGVILLYSLLSYQQHVRNPSDTTIPNLRQIVEGVKMAFTPDRNNEIWFFRDVVATGKRLFLGLGIGVLASFVLGIGIGVSPHLNSIFGPPVMALSKIPPTAMLAVYFVLFGTDLELFVAIIALGIFPSLCIAIASSVQKDVSIAQIDKAYTLGASNMEVITNVVIPQILPRFLQNVQLVIGPAAVFVIAAEWLMADVGFGYRLRIQSRLLNMNLVYVYLASLCVLGFLGDWSLTLIRRYYCRWFGE